MLSIGDVGLRRELQSILTIYLATLLNGYSSGFSAVAVPGIKEEMERRWRLDGRVEHSHWSSNVEAGLSLVERIIVLLAPALLCHKEPA